MMRSLSTNAFGHPSDTKLTFGGAACSELRFRGVMISIWASGAAASAQVELRNERDINEQKDGP